MSDATAVTPRKGLSGWWALVALVVLIAAVVIATNISAQREEDARVDGYYCTLAGIGPFDRGPNTGRLCADILND